jgi:hypothetical protein
MQMNHMIRIAGASRGWKLVAATGLAVVAIASAAALAFAGGSNSGVTRVGPFTATNYAQIGSCGNTWAVTDYKLVYTVYPQNPDGSYTVVQTAAGHGSTRAGASPNACNGDNGATVGDGIPVNEPNDISVQRISGGTFSPHGTCSGPCFFANFTPAFFGASATHTPMSVNYVLGTPCNGQLIFFTDVTTQTLYASSGDITGNKSNCRP